MAYDIGDLVTLGHLESVSQAIADKNYVTSAVSGISAGSIGGVEVDDNIIPLTIEKTYGGGASASELDISIPEKTVTSSSGTATLSDGGTFSTISSLTVDDYGRVSSYTKRTNTLPTLDVSEDVANLSERLDAIETFTGWGDYKVASGILSASDVNFSTTLTYRAAKSIGALIDYGIPSADAIVRVSVTPVARGDGTSAYGPTCMVMPSMNFYLLNDVVYMYITYATLATTSFTRDVDIHWTIWYTEE